MKYQSLKERYRCLVRGPAEAGPEVVPESREVESEGEAGILDPLQPPRLLEVTYELYIVYRQVFEVPYILHLEPSLDAFSLWSDVTSPIKILSLLR